MSPVLLPFHSACHTARPSEVKLVSGKTPNNPAPHKVGDYTRLRIQSNTSRHELKDGHAAPGRTVVAAITPLQGFKDHLFSVLTALRPRKNYKFLTLTSS